MDEYELLGTHPIDFSMEENHKLALTKGELLDCLGRYRRLIRHVIYLTITRPDLNYVVHILLHFMYDTKKEHMDGTGRVLRYIKATPSQGILLRPDNRLQVVAHCNANWGAVLPHNAL